MSAGDVGVGVGVDVEVGFGGSGDVGTDVVDGAIEVVTTGVVIADGAGCERVGEAVVQPSSTSNVTINKTVKIHFIPASSRHLG